MSNQAKPVVVSGIRATGRLHLGNYFGAIRNYPPLQDDHDCYFFVADYHTLTTAPDAEQLKKHRLPIVKTFLATGIDPAKAAIFYQSSLPEVAELTLLLNMVVKVAELQNCTTFKEMVKKHPDNVNNGLFTYPVLMAADIIIHKATIVPVGNDQLQHIEMARDFADRFNGRYGQTFPRPKELLHDEIGRLPGLDGEKMGKSDNNAIDLLDDEKTVAKKVMTAITDKNRIKKNDSGDPDNNCVSIFPLLRLLADDQQLQEIRTSCREGKLGCVDCKKNTAVLITQFLAPIQNKYNNIADDFVLDILKDGAKKAQKSARKTLNEVRNLMGLE